MLAVAASCLLFMSRPLSPAEMEARAGLARLLCRDGRHDDALKIYTELMEETRQAPFVRLGLAAAFFEKGNYAKAEEQYRILLVGEPDSPVALHDLAQTLLKQGRNLEAAEYLRRFNLQYSRLLSDGGNR